MDIGINCLLFGSSDAISKNILPILFLWMLIFFLTVMSPSLFRILLRLGLAHFKASKQIFTEWMHKNLIFPFFDKAQIHEKNWN